VFPDRETAEATYELTGEWGHLFDAILTYARTMVRRAEGRTKLEQRMNWWAALALLRCASSSPAAAAMALHTRLKAVEGASEAEQIAEIEQLGAETVFDGESGDELSRDETVPAGTTGILEEDAADAKALERLIERAERLKGAAKDPKLALLTEKVKALLEEGFCPVVFCRYIATAHYVAEELGKTLAKEKAVVAAVTGELTSDEREDRVLRLEDDERVPVLVATDCLSEGINLQRRFNAVVHYDLVWNPTRHEQREGRVDRFGQPRPAVRALMLYGESNPIDGAVLQVILRKAEKIRKELGVSVPMPADSNKVMETIMQTVLLRSGGIGHAQEQQQLNLDFGDTEQEVEIAWESTKQKARDSRWTRFAQRRLRPEEVLPEWQKQTTLLGGPDDVARFVRTATERLRAPLEKKGNTYRLPVDHLPAPLKEQLAAAGIEKSLRLSFVQPAPAGTEYVHRAHPLVAALADYVAERALAEENPDLAARSAAVFTDDVTSRTAVFLLRLRTQLTTDYHSGKQKGKRRNLLSEECLAVAVTRGSDPEILTETEVRRLMSVVPSRNMVPEQRERQIARELEALKTLEGPFRAIAETRADELLADHTRVRAASRGRGEAMGMRFQVKACFPDVIGVYVFLPTPRIP
jgi:hypothetical protein